jgi:arylsulfatase
VDTPENTDGISFLPELTGEKQTQHEYLFWEFPETGGQQAVRMGKWKAVRENIQKGDLEIQLFNLETDPLEQNNVASLNPDVVNTMKQIMQNEHRQAENPVFRMKALDAKS